MKHYISNRLLGNNGLFSVFHLGLFEAAITVMWLNTLPVILLRQLERQSLAIFFNL